MNSHSIHFRCPQCGARIKAPAQLVGRRRDCPRCGRPVLVRRSSPRDADPVLAPLEREEGRSLGVAYRRGA